MELFDWVIKHLDAKLLTVGDGYVRVKAPVVPDSVLILVAHMGDYCCTSSGWASRLDN